LSAPRDSGTPGNGSEGSQTLSEPQPLRPEDVPAELLAAAKAAGLTYDRQTPGSQWDWEGYNAAIIAAVLPALGDQIAEAILDDGHGRECPRVYQQCAETARRITRGQAPRPDPDEPDEPAVVWPPPAVPGVHCHCLIHVDHRSCDDEQCACDAPASESEEPLIDPDCRSGKCGSCVGGPCQHHCHQRGRG
jgi:hypothetical protein